jgi:hypothetical protein
VKCQRFYRPDKNGVHVLEQKPIQNGAQPGLIEPENWEPYKVWRADRWKCEGCQHELVTGFGFHPMWEDYRGLLPFHIDHTVNDC